MEQTVDKKTKKNPLSFSGKVFGAFKLNTKFDRILSKLKLGLLKIRWVDQNEVIFL